MAKLIKRTLFQPVSETAMEHLVAEPRIQEILKLRYVGPVIDENDHWCKSPDCLMVDEETNQLVKCEFKVEPEDALAFKDNKFFDIAIVWSLHRVKNKTIFHEDLKKQNHCERVIVLTDNPFFRALTPYTNADINSSMNFRIANPPSVEKEFADKIGKIGLDESVFVAYVASKLYPDAFDRERLLSYIRSPEVFNLEDDSTRSAHGNFIGALLQIKPIRMVEKLKKDTYRWNEYYNRANPIEVIKKRLTVLVGASKIPDDKTIDHFRVKLPTS